MKAKRKASPISIPYGKQSISAADIQAVVKVLKSDFLTQGPTVSAFEDAIAKFCGVKYVVAFSNGTAALHAACFAAGLGLGDEGITSPISFTASANCMLFQGATPRFADIDPATAQITAKTVSEVLNARTKVIIPVDFAGRPSDLDELAKLCKKKNLTLILDAAHSFGATYSSHSKTYKTGSCSHADMTILSFHPVKSFTTGEGGAVTTNNKSFYERLKRFRHHGITKAPEEFINPEFANCGWYYEMHDLGYNYRLTDIQCALGLSQLKRVKTFMAARKKIADTYRKRLKGKVGFLAGDDLNHKSANHILPVLVEAKRREDIFQALRDRGIGTQLHYLPIYRQPFYKNLFGDLRSQYPASEEYFSRTLTLPIFPDLKKAELDYVIKTLTTILSA